MSDQPNAIRDDAPSPWWPCPECGGIHWRTTVVFERGEWVDENTWEAYDPPMGMPTGVNISEAECVDCGAIVSLGETYGWPIVGEFDGGDA